MDALLPVYITPYFACSLVYKLTGSILSDELLKFHPSDWLIEIYLQTESQGTHHNMVSLQPMPGFSPLIRFRNFRF